MLGAIPVISGLGQQTLMVLALVTNAVLGGGLVYAVYWQYKRNPAHGAFAGILYGTLVIVAEQMIGTHVLNFPSWTATRFSIVAAAVGSVIGASIVAAYILDAPYLIRVAIPGLPTGSESEEEVEDESDESDRPDVDIPELDEDSWNTFGDRTIESPEGQRPIDIILNKLPLPIGGDLGRNGRIPMEELNSDEIQRAMNYLEATGQDADKDGIEEAAYSLEQTDTEENLVSAFETASERGDIDRSLVAPDNVDERLEWHTRDGSFYQILTATSLPRLVSAGWLVPLTLSEHDVRISMQIDPRETKTVKDRLQRRLTQMKSAIQWKQQRGRTDIYEEEHERRELERLLQDVIEGATKLFDLGLYLEIKGATLEQMKDASRRVQRRVGEQGMELTPLEARQDQAQQAIAPVGRDPITNTNTVQVEALATFFNFVEPAIEEIGGIQFGFDDTQRPVIIDRYSLSGHSKVITGKIGSGKSYAAKMALYRRLLVDHHLRSIIFDPLGDDFVDFAKKLDGTIIRFGGKYRVNPLDINPPQGAEEEEDLYAIKVRNVLEILKTYLENRGGMSAGEEGVLTNAIHYAYLVRGITPDPSTFHQQSPTMDDVIEGITKLANGGLSTEEIDDLRPESVQAAVADGGEVLGVEESLHTLENPSDQHIKIAQQLQPKFESFKRGNINNNLNGQTNIDLSSRIVVFDMQSFSDTGEMPLIMHAMLNWAYEEARRSDLRTDVTFEEAHYLLRRPGARKLLNLFIRHARHFDAGLTLISQTVDEFLRNDNAREIYDQCDIKQMFYMENVSDAVRDYFDLSAEEVRFIMKASRGENSPKSECLLSTSEHGRRRLEIYSGGYERHLLEDDLTAWGWLNKQNLLTERDLDYLENDPTKEVHRRPPEESQERTEVHRHGTGVQDGSGKSDTGVEEEVHSDGGVSPAEAESDVAHDTTVPGGETPTSADRTATSGEPTSAADIPEEALEGDPTENQPESNDFLWHTDD